MSKKTCFMIFTVLVISLIAAFILNISEITMPAQKVFSTMKNPYIAISAIICALLLQKQKHYFLLMLACAILCAVLVQFFIVGGALAFYPILYKSLAFLAYVYLLVLIRFML